MIHRFKTLQCQTLFPAVVVLFFSTFNLYGQNFVKVADPANPINIAEPGVATGGYVGASWIDFDNDGKLDLFSNRRFLYRNDGNNNFTKIENVIGGNLAQRGGNGNTWADYDNDGDLDCFYVGCNSRLYRNDGNGNFTAIRTGPLGDSLATRGWSAAWADYDNDSYVDLLIVHPANFVCQFLTPIPPALPNLLYHNDGPPNYTFTPVTTWEFTTALAPYTVATWSDYDNDGDMDLFIGSGPATGQFAPDYLYRNLLKETGKVDFMRITAAPIATDLVDGQVWNWIDYDNDGDLDAYLTNYGASPTTAGLANNLYRNDKGTFTRMTGAQAGSIVTDVDASLGSLWGDFDNDGDLDAYVTQEGGWPRRYYRNNGDGTFTGLNAGDLVAGTNQNVGSTAGDYDADGDLDIYVTGSGATRALYRNELTNGNSWSNIRCLGTQSNRAAIGAKVRAKATINGKAIWQVREISSQNSFNGHNMLNAHFGFGQAMIIDSLKVEWPSGKIDVARNVPVNRFLTITEGVGITTAVKETPTEIPTHFALLQNHPNPFNPATTIRYNVPQSTHVVLSVYNLVGERIITLVNQVQAAGTHAITWDGSDAQGQALSSGIYLYKIEAGTFAQTRKLTLVK